MLLEFYPNYPFTYGVIKKMREVLNLFSFDSVVQVKRSCYFTDYQFRRPTKSSGLVN